MLDARRSRSRSGFLLNLQFYYCCFFSFLLRVAVFFFQVCNLGGEAVRGIPDLIEMNGQEATSDIHIESLTGIKRSLHFDLFLCLVVKNGNDVTFHSNSIR